MRDLSHPADTRSELGGKQPPLLCPLPSFLPFFSGIYQGTRRRIRASDDVVRSPRYSFLLLPWWGGGLAHWVIGSPPFLLFVLLPCSPLLTLLLFSRKKPSSLSYH